MGKGTLPGLKNSGSVAGWGEHRRCIACKRRIVWGERCEGCKRELAARRRRKPR